MLQLSTGAQHLPHCMRALQAVSGVMACYCVELRSAAVGVQHGQGCHAAHGIDHMRTCRRPSRGCGIAWTSVRRSVGDLIVEQQLKAIRWSSKYASAKHLEGP